MQATMAGYKNVSPTDGDDENGEQSLPEWYVDHLAEREDIDVSDPLVRVSWRTLPSGRESPTIETPRQKIQGYPTRFECPECGKIGVLDDFVQYRIDNTANRTGQHASRCQCGEHDLERVGDAPQILGGEE